MWLVQKLYNEGLRVEGQEEAPFRNTYISKRAQKSWSWISRRLKPGMTVLVKASSSLTDQPS
jgi:hypothetical protein